MNNTTNSPVTGNQMVFSDKKDVFKNCCVFLGNIDLPNPLLSGLKSEPVF
jgi:hypothetical protein